MDKNKIKMWYDEDILYISFKEGPSVDSEEKEGIRLEYDKNGNVIGIEVEEIARKLVKPIAKKLITTAKLR